MSVYPTKSCFSAELGLCLDSMFGLFDTSGGKIGDLQQPTYGVVLCLLIKGSMIRWVGNSVTE